jgi:hypothetical protein
MSSPSLSVGQWVSVRSQEGQVRYVGPTGFAEGEWVGIELSTAVGRHDGTVRGVRYFTCQPRHGLFVQQALCVPIDGPSGSAGDPGTAEELAAAWAAIEMVDEAAALQAGRESQRVLQHLSTHYPQVTALLDRYILSHPPAFGPLSLLPAHSRPGHPRPIPCPTLRTLSPPCPPTPRQASHHRLSPPTLAYHPQGAATLGKQPSLKKPAPPHRPIPPCVCINPRRYPTLSVFCPPTPGPTLSCHQGAATLGKQPSLKKRDSGGKDTARASRAHVRASLADSGEDGYDEVLSALEIPAGYTGPTFHSAPTEKDMAALLAHIKERVAAEDTARGGEAAVPQKVAMRLLLKVRDGLVRL